MKRALILLVGGLLVNASGLEGQSLFGSRGLGMQMNPLDARAMALGGQGLALLGPSLSPVDLASAARIYLPSAQVTLQPQWVDGELGGSVSSTMATRFPQVGLAYPVPRFGGTALMQIESFMDQRWNVMEASEQEFRGEVVPVNDQFQSDGGISTFQLGWAQRVGDDLSLGIGVGSRIGSVTRTFTRFIQAEGDFFVIPFQVAKEWQYSGLTASLGFQWDPVSAIRLGGSARWSQDLKAEDSSTEDTETFDLPVEYRFGASGILTPRLAITAGFSYADWKPSDEGGLQADALSGAVKSFGGGLEWAGPTLGPRNFPIRVGMRRSDLPFTFEGETPSEQVFSGGIGLNLMPPQTGLVGVIDLALERGTREAGSLSEKFWRASATFRVGSF
jgi:hypothetical protein